MQVQILCDQNVTGSSVYCITSYVRWSVVNKVKIKSEFMNDALTNLSIF